MYLDKQNIFSDVQTLVLAAGSYVSTNSVDVGLLGVSPGQTSPATALPVGPNGAIGGVIHDPSRGFKPELLCQVVTGLVSGGTATLNVQLIQATDAALTAGIDVITETGVMAAVVDAAGANYPAGFHFKLAFPGNGITKRYIGMRYVIGTAAITAGAVTAGVVLNRQLSY